MLLKYPVSSLAVILVSLQTIIARLLFFSSQRMDPCARFFVEGYRVPPFFPACLFLKMLGAFFRVLRAQYVESSST